MLNFQVEAGGSLSGRLQIPADKSISHRAIMLSAIANGRSHISNFLPGEDCLATLQAFRAMGVQIEQHTDNNLTVHGVGLHGLQAPLQAIDCGNSGTSIRLLAGLLAGQKFDSELTGDSSLRARPMQRVVLPLHQMGANIHAQDGKAPIQIKAGNDLSGIDYQLPIKSAQLKSCCQLAALYAQGETRIRGGGRSRDHTERMLQAFSYPIEYSSDEIRITSGGELQACDIQIPGDISSAAFFMVAASISPGSEITLEGVGINPTRMGVIEILQQMGADIQFSAQRELGAEPVADIHVKSAPLTGITIPSDAIVSAIDEFPAIFIAAACANGETILRNAAQLREKESDRIRSMVKGLQNMGINVQEFTDGVSIKGGILRGAEIDSHGDHRIAMAFAVAGLASEQAVFIRDCANVATSFPNFVALAQQAGLAISQSRSE